MLPRGPTQAMEDSQAQKHQEDSVCPSGHPEEKGVSADAAGGTDIGRGAC